MMQMRLVNRGGFFDIQSIMTNPIMKKIPWFRKYDGEFHYPGGYSYLGPGTRLRYSIRRE